MKPGDQTPGAVYDPVTHQYKVPAEPDVVEVSDPDETTPVVGPAAFGPDDDIVHWRNLS